MTDQPADVQYEFVDSEQSDAQLAVRLDSFRTTFDISSLYRTIEQNKCEANVWC